jgi:hypothetical protein
MALLVKYENDGIGYVPAYELKELLQTGKVKNFMRSNGQWVDPKKGPIRGQGSPNSYNGPERRARWQ